jgi:protein SCO1
MKEVRIVLWALVLIALVGGGVVLWQKNRGDGSLVSIGGAFTLTDTKGERFTEADLKGKPYAMFFGFTHCPDVCPTTLWEMTTHLKALGDDGDRLNMVFVGVDHERDTPEHLGTYLSAFDDRIIGLSGTEEQIARMAKTYRIFFERVEDASGDILYNHSAQVLLFKANGQFKSTIAYEERAETAFEKLKLLVD